MDDSCYLPLLLRRVLVATDLSPAARSILGYAAQFCRRFGTDLSVVHVLHPDYYPFQLPETWPQMADVQVELGLKIESLIRSTLRSMPHEMILEKGEIWPTIRRTIQTKKIDLLIAGTHGRSGISKAILGSVAEQMVRCADCPVLTIGPHVPTSDGSPLQLNRILYATDFSAKSLSAVRLAITLGKLSDTRLTFLHCHKDGETTSALLEALAQIVPLGVGLSAPPECFVKSPPHRLRILELAHEQRASLIVLGIPGTNWNSKLKTHFTNSDTYHIVSEADCPVVTVRS